MILSMPISGSKTIGLHWYYVCNNLMDGQKERIKNVHRMFGGIFWMRRIDLTLCADWWQWHNTINFKVKRYRVPMDPCRCRHTTPFISSTSVNFMVVISSKMKTIAWKPISLRRIFSKRTHSKWWIIIFFSVYSSNIKLKSVQHWMQQ